MHVLTIGKRRKSQSGGLKYAGISITLLATLVNAADCLQSPGMNRS